MQTLIGNFIVAHQQWFAGLALGFILSNPGTCALLLFTGFTKIPGAGYWIGKNPDKAKAWIDAFNAKIDALIDKYAAASADADPVMAGARPSPSPAPASPATPPA